MEISLCGLPKANLATFCYGGNKTSVGDAVGKHSLQIWVGWMEPQSAAEISPCEKLVCSLLPLAQGEGAERCGLVSRCNPFCWVVLHVGAFTKV